MKVVVVVVLCSFCVLVVFKNALFSFLLLLCSVSMTKPSGGGSIE